MSYISIDNESVTSQTYVDYDVTGAQSVRFGNDGPGRMCVKADGGDEIGIREGEEFTLPFPVTTLSVKIANGTMSSFRLLALL